MKNVRLDMQYLRFHKFLHLKGLGFRNMLKFPQAYLTVMKGKTPDTAF